MSAAAMHLPSKHRPSALEPGAFTSTRSSARLPFLVSGRFELEFAPHKDLVMAKNKMNRKNSDSPSALGMVGGAAAGAAAGSMVGPLGAAIGAVVGGAAGANAKAIARRVPQAVGSTRKLMSAGTKSVTGAKRKGGKSSGKKVSATRSAKSPARRKK
jgi:hypothetical protein